MSTVVKKYFVNVNYFFVALVIFLLLIQSKVDLTITTKYIICFFLIATIGISHGAYDGHKGLVFLKEKINFPKLLFYFTYISLVFICFLFLVFKSKNLFNYFLNYIFLSFWQRRFGNLHN